LKKREKVVSAIGDFVFFVYIEYILYIQPKISYECTLTTKKYKLLKNKEKSFFADSGGHAAHLPRVRSAKVGRIGSSASWPQSARTQTGGGGGIVSEKQKRRQASTSVRPLRPFFIFLQKELTSAQKRAIRQNVF